MKRFCTWTATFLLSIAPLACDDKDGDDTAGDDTSEASETSDSDSGDLTASSTTGNDDASSGADSESASGTSSDTAEDTTGATSGETSTTASETGDTGEPATCKELIAAFEAEAAAIRSCDEDAQCGQVLQGTSCGCTRDWVARLDADTTEFYTLIDQLAEMECDYGLGSTCDCPEADGYACESGVCGWNYVGG